jgi:D-arabinose 1-dehydrogenase-like Zn-dependent alcohol dehydrogenase
LAPSSREQIHALKPPEIVPEAAFEAYRSFVPPQPAAPSACARATTTTPPSSGVNVEGNDWNCFAGCGGGRGSTAPEALARNMAEQLTRNVSGFGDALAASLADMVRMNARWLVQSFVPNDVVDLFIGLSILLGPMWLARRGVEA